MTQKVPYWFRLTARGEPGYGSRPREASSVTRLVAALERLRLHEFEARIVPAVDAYFKGLAPAAPAKWQGHYANMRQAIRTPRVADADPSGAAASLVVVQHWVEELKRLVPTN